MKIPDLSTIEEAAERIKGQVHRTPIFTSKSINELVKAEIYLKSENFQKAGAFKFRGAINNVLSLTRDELKHGVCTHSSGNHAQALALAAQIVGIKAYIIMPENSSKVKINAVKYYGGIITFCKPNLASREETLKKIQQETNACEIHPYNNYRTIAGQATSAKELLEDINDLDYIMVPVGGGGLLSGTALATYYLSPKTKVIAAEPEKANDAYLSFYSGKFVPSVNPQTIADGLLTSLGSLTYPIIRKYVHQIITVREESIINAMKLVWERMKIIIEPSSAVPVAALLESASCHNPKLEITGKRIGIIISGGNVDLTKLPWLNS
ncbi:MAG: pyridoxal-phosphate dependent enzyme [Bacteroidales bacterium]|nr:pyridoxal-phosphate dependent enzyme [Bacteroidales bacterium]